MCSSGAIPRALLITPNLPESAALLADDRA